mmetsp:Transcript_68803/g.165140  ORF Transcript_68803/g.165140 Transcript_68803/m.165140 type:complete len:244 (+) Transcript_68803:65-796(+)
MAMHTADTLAVRTLLQDALAALQAQLEAVQAQNALLEKRCEEQRAEVLQLTGESPPPLEEVARQASLGSPSKGGSARNVKIASCSDANVQRLSTSSSEQQPCGAVPSGSSAMTGKASELFDIWKPPITPLAAWQETALAEALSSSLADSGPETNATTCQSQEVGSTPQRPRASGARSSVAVPDRRSSASPPGRRTSAAAPQRTSTAGQGRSMSTSPGRPTSPSTAAKKNARPGQDINARRSFR